MIVWLVISSYRNDKEVLRILEESQASGQDLFQRTLVIDSEGTGVIQSAVEERGCNFGELSIRQLGFAPEATSCRAA